MIKEWLTINELKSVANVSIPTINRVKSNLIDSDYQKLIDTRRRPHLYNKAILSELVSSYFYQLMCLTDYISRNKEINLSSIGTDYAQYLLSFDWKLFGTITYKEPKGVKSCVRNMNSIYKTLSKKYKIKHIFFATEHNTKRGEGYHNHFVIDCDKSQVDEVRKTIEKLCYKFEHQPTIEDYNYKKLGSSYITKLLDKEEDGYGLL